MSALALLTLAVIAAAPSLPRVAELRWEKRVLLVAAPDAATLAGQRDAFAAVGRSGDDRDLVLVEVIGDRVRGVSDPADRLRRDYRLPVGRFEAVLIGKDGGVKRRSATPLTAADLTATIDAMPMRRAGER